MKNLTPYKSYTSYGDALVAYSALKAGGFKPVFQNIHTAQLNTFEALALGGFWILLPSLEHEDAVEWQNWLKKNQIKDTGSKVRSNFYIFHAVVAAGLLFGFAHMLAVLLINFFKVIF